MPHQDVVEIVSAVAEALDFASCGSYLAFASIATIQAIPMRMGW